jgi:hypothetical protein
MAKWTDLSYNKEVNRNNEYKVEGEYELNDNVGSYGILEDLTMDNCYGVEQVYENYDRDWN